METEMNHTATKPCPKEVQEPSADALGVMCGVFRATLNAFAIQCPPELEMAFADRAVNSLGGEQLYFPRVGTKRRKETKEWIEKHWTGNNVKELSRATGLSERRVRQLVSQQQTSKTEINQ